MLLEGIFLPLTTPFYPDGRVYLRKLEHNVRRASLTPAAGMLVMGPNGEAAGLTDHEACEVLGAAIEAALPEKVMIAGVGRESAFATLALCEAAAAVGYDAVALRVPDLLPSMRAERVTYFQAVADRCPLPMVVVSGAGRELAADEVAELAGHPGVIGVIDSRAAERMEGYKALPVSREVTVTTIFAAVTGRMQRQVVTGAGAFVSAETLGHGGGVATAPPVSAIRTRVKRVGFQVLAGETSTMLAAWQAGAAGAVPGLGACAPQACCEVWQAHKDGDPGLAEEKQVRVAMAAALVRSVATIKYGCDWNGYFGGRPRLPLLALTGEERAVVEEALAGMRN